MQALSIEEEAVETAALQRVEHMGCEGRPTAFKLGTALAYNIYKTRDK